MTLFEFQKKSLLLFTSTWTVPVEKEPYRTVPYTTTILVLLLPTSYMHLSTQHCTFLYYYKDCQVCNICKQPSGRREVLLFLWLVHACCCSYDDSLFFHPCRPGIESVATVSRQIRYRPVPGIESVAIVSRQVCPVATLSIPGLIVATVSRRVRVRVYLSRIGRVTRLGAATKYLAIQIFAIKSVLILLTCRSSSAATA